MGDTQKGIGGCCNPLGARQVVWPPTVFDGLNLDSDFSLRAIFYLFRHFFRFVRHFLCISKAILIYFFCFCENAIWRISKCVNWANNNMWQWYVFILFLWHIWHVWILFCENIYLKNDIFKICFRQSAKCRMTAQTGRKYNVFVKICNLECILPSKRRFFSSDPFCVFSV